MGTVKEGKYQEILAIYSVMEKQCYSLILKIPAFDYHIKSNWEKIRYVIHRVGIITLEK